MFVIVSEKKIISHLQVLYCFLEVFCKFDWDNYYVSIWAQCPEVQFLTWLLVCVDPYDSVYGISCFNNNHKECFVIIGSDYCILYTTVDPPRRDGGELLLSELVYAYITAYTVLPPNPDFKLKCFNTIDPLLWNNNLGIRVSEGEIHHIKLK